MMVIEVIIGVAPGIEERLFGLKGDLNGIPIGRMSLVAAVLFFILNLALLVFHISRRHEIWCRGFAVALSLAVLCWWAV